MSQENFKVFAGTLILLGLWDLCVEDVYCKTIRKKSYTNYSLHLKLISLYKCQLIYVHKRLLKGAQNHASSDAKWSFKRYESPTIVITVA